MFDSSGVIMTGSGTASCAATYIPAPGTHLHGAVLQLLP